MKNLELDMRTKYFLTREGFFERIYQLMNDGKSIKESYEIAEDDYEDVVGERKYNGYDSFRSAFFHFEKSEKSKNIVRWFNLDGKLDELNK